MPCTLCGGLRHNRLSCSKDESLETLFARISLVATEKKQCRVKKTVKSMKGKDEEGTCEPSIVQSKKLMTEDTGKVFEKAICLKYGIEYKGNYKYGDERALEIQHLLTSLPEMFPSCSHTAEKGSQHDFTAVDKSKHLSAKTCKRGTGKVAPQQFGQCSVQKLWNKMEWEDCEIEDRKRMIQENIKLLLPLFERFTFDCDVIYYHEKRKEVRYIKSLGLIDWEKEEFKWTKSWDKWNNSSTLKVKRGDKYVSVLEMQFHKNGRSNMCNRWAFERLLEAFPDNFQITTWK